MTPVNYGYILLALLTDIVYFRQDDNLWNVLKRKYGMITNGIHVRNVVVVTRLLVLIHI